MNVENLTPAFAKAMAEAQGELGNAAKNAKNPHFRSSYADLGEVLATVKPVLSKHGLSLIQSTAFDGQMVHVTTILTHASGGYISSVASCVPPKADAQGVGSATTYLRRYSAAAMCAIGQEDDDGNSAAHNKPAVISEKQLALLEAKITETASDTVAFCNAMGVPSLTDIPVAQFKRAVDLLNKKAAAMKAAQKPSEAAVEDDNESA